MTRIAVLFAGALLLAACGSKEADTTAPQYGTAAVEKTTLAVGVEAAGVIEPIRTVEVKSKASGEILEIRVETGDNVEQGSLMVRIDPRTPSNRVAQTESEYKASLARLARAKAQLDRGKKLLDQSWINKADYDQLVLDVANAESQVVAARVAVENARISLEDTDIRAPINGTVISKKVERGQVISSPTQDVGGGTLLLTMANLDQVRVRGRVDETDVGKLREGMPAQVMVAAFPGQPFNGSIARIEPLAVVEQNVTLFSVLIALDNKDGLLKPGMNVEIKIDVAKRPDVLTLPVMALRTDRDIEPTAQILGIEPDALRAQLEPPKPAGEATSAEAPPPAGPKTLTLGDRTIELPAGVEPDQVRALMQKRRAGEELKPEERALLRKVFQGMGQGGAATGARQAAFQFSGNFWVVKDVAGKYVPTPVKAGLTDLDRIEITSGLAEGDKVLLLPSASLIEAQQQLQNFINRRFGSGIPGMTQKPGGQSGAQGGAPAGGAAGGASGSGRPRQ
ncbi:MAG: efflux RND transporter periplasmic adaptor subunit [Gammaproteobacteria bacterium]|nr:efflux RND transporter periplasmic adaptor subunit [Gammaproteobacteria bacterium]